HGEAFLAAPAQRAEIGEGVARPADAPAPPAREEAARELERGEDLAGLAVPDAADAAQPGQGGPLGHALEVQGDLAREGQHVLAVLAASEEHGQQFLIRKRLGALARHFLAGPKAGVEQFEGIGYLKGSFHATENTVAPGVAPAGFVT